jgi:hypothetical protein
MKGGKEEEEDAKEERSWSESEVEEVETDGVDRIRECARSCVLMEWVRTQATSQGQESEHDEVREMRTESTDWRFIRNRIWVWYYLSSSHSVGC